MAVAAQALLGAATAGAVESRYPDLRTLPPYDLRFDTETIGGRTHRLLRFSNVVWNAGQGLMHLVGVSNWNSETTAVYQYVFNSNGGYTRHQVGTFTYHREHDHWHFEDFSDFELWKQADLETWLRSGRTQGRPFLTSEKTTSCVMDTRIVRRLAGTPSNGAYDSVCGTAQQGLSVGWGDLYGYWLWGQWIDLGTTRLADGKYAVRSVAAPRNRLYESAGKNPSNSRETPADNEGITWFEVRNGAIRLDTAGPLSAAPAHSLVRNTQLTTGASVPVRVRRSASDALSGVARYQLRRSTNGGAYSLPYTTAGTYTTALLAPGSRYQYQDRAGSWGAWRSGPAFTPTVAQETAAAFSGSWQEPSITGALGGRLRLSIQEGATAATPSRPRRSRGSPAGDRTAGWPRSTSTARAWARTTCTRRRCSGGR